MRTLLLLSLVALRSHLHAADGTGAATIIGELKQWHKVTLVLDGPFAHEKNDAPNPFTDLAFNVTFTHESGASKYIVSGYFAADGHAANSSAESGTKWLAHVSPDKTGTWTYKVSFTKGKHTALDGGGEALKPFDGITGTFAIAASDKTGRDFRGKGRLQYVGKHHLQFAGSKEYFLKAGADAPETLLGYADFDNTVAGKPDKVPLKKWQPHVQDWKAGDPTWKDGKGKGLIGALNYLSGKGANSFSFLTYNAAGDGDNVWPFVERNDKLHYEREALKAGHRTNGELIGQKTDGWEGGHRVPLMARWPEHIAPNTVRKEFFLQVDLMATLAEAAQITLPAGASPDGASELAAFIKPASTPAKRTEDVMLGSGTYVLRQGDWLYIPKQGSAGYSAPEKEKPWSVPYALMGFKNSDVDEHGQIKPGSPKEQLYDLSKDITEAKNIAREHPERAASMRARLLELTGKSKARTPRRVTTFHL